MSQHDFDIANQTASNARADINLALKALGSLSSGGSAPATTYANMLWHDTSANILKMRAEANDAWINVGYLDQSADAFRILDNTQVVNTSGTQTGLLGDQATSTWQAGTGTVDSLVSPANVKAAIDALAFQDVSLAEQGKVKLGFGLEVIWGWFNAKQDDNHTESFHTPFTNACWGMSLGGVKDDHGQGFGGHSTCTLQVLSKTQFVANRNNDIYGTSYDFWYIAWGY